MRILMLTGFALALASCSSNAPAPVNETQTAKAPAPPKPTDESHRFPKANLVSTQVVDTALLGKSFMPGGTLAHYQKGAAKYQMFVARAANANDAAIRLGEWRAALNNPEFVASFGGYFGRDEGAPVFVFTKGEWIAGVVGLRRNEADAMSRLLASRL